MGGQLFTFNYSTGFGFRNMIPGGKFITIARNPHTQVESSYSFRGLDVKWKMGIAEYLWKLNSSVEFRNEM